jgi:serine/threonine-protein kinase
MAIDSFAPFIGTLARLELVSPAQLQEAEQKVRPRCRDVQELARALLSRGWLTPYQVNQLLQGHGKDLALGSYILLERLGEGGMGQVFKAKHKKLERVVALKQIHKKLVANADMVERFHREIQAAAQLSHPNIVLAYDADEIDGIHFYTMEYVEGTTLGQLLDRSGAMQVSLACEYIRQAAVGLQHAHEKGLVHRDIKPANLILTWTSKPANPAAGAAADERNRVLWGSHMPLIKIFDMGLALIKAPRLITGEITEKGQLMGTPDFMSPEQALNPHRADIRSDLYSLGATFYSLATGALPFPGGTALEKVIAHRSEEPRPMAKVRPGVPAEVQAIVSKLMAKSPEKRYQTPGELASVLTVYLAQAEKASAERRSSRKR